MGLSEYDKKVLEQLERDLLGADDPIARKLGAKAKPTNSAAKLIAGALVAVVGMSLLVAAISHLILFGLAGFVVALAGLVVASANPVGRGTEKPKTPKSAAKGSFFENRWDQRRDQN